MDVAVHIRSLADTDLLQGVDADLERHYINGNSQQHGHWEHSLPKPGRIYVGDEFCPARLPTAPDMEGFCRFAAANSLELTLLTPVMTDPEITAAAPLLTVLRRYFPHGEVVVNDIGVLFYLKTAFPGFRPAMGRLFNKGFKDPRLDEQAMNDPGRQSGLLNDTTFRRSNFQGLARDLGVARLEQDLFPYADPCFEPIHGLKISWYFPFGYVTTGRVCFTAGMNRHGGRRFSIAPGCSAPCSGASVALKHPCLSFNLVRNGNTVFYRYRRSMLDTLINRIWNTDFRLVYQGGCR